MRLFSYSLFLLMVMASSLFGGEFTSLDINTGLSGSTVYNGLESYTVRGGGSDIWNTQDSFRFVYQTYSGDFDIQAKVISVDPTDAWAKAGLMLRQDTSANSIHAMMSATSGNGFAFQYRSTLGGASSQIAGGTTGYPFSWVRLIRSGSLVAGYKSTDPIGAEWQFVGSVSLSIADPVLVGLCVTAHNNSQVCKAEFANVNINPFVPPVSGSGTGLSAKYFNNKTFSGTPALERIDGTLDFNWLIGSPDPAVNADNFCSHWSGFIEPQYSESYSFHTSSDDGIRVWVDGTLVLDNWTLHAPQANRTFAKSLIAGERYPIVVEFFENGGGAEARLYWSSRSTFKQIIPQSQLYPDAVSISVGEGSGLKGEYFNSREFTNLTLTRMDPNVDFSWGSASPALTVSADDFSVRWTGAVEPKHTGLYSFFTTSDDGVRLWVNNQLIINNWTDHGPTENAGSIPLIAGQRYSIRMEYYEHGGGAVAKLAWSSADQTKETIPVTQLYPANGSGFFAEYFDNADLTQPVFHRVDSKIDFNWGELAPNSSLGVDTFSIRWSGRLEPKYNESYTFYTDTDEAVRLWVNNQLVIDNWAPHSRTENASAAISLIIGLPVEIKMEYADITGNAVAKLSWSSFSQVKQAIPTSQVYPNGGMVVSVPASSPISPAFIEGTRWSPSDSSFTLSCNSNNTPVPVTTMGSKRFFVNIPLQSVIGTDVSFQHSETGTAQSGLITWTTTDIAGKNSSANQLLLRKGDSLQLTATGSGAAMTIDANGDGSTDFTGTPGTIVPYQYTQTGQFVASAKIDGVLVGELLITVVDVDWRGEAACIVGFSRTKNVSVIPATAANNVIFTSADSALLNVSLKELTSSGASLLLRPNDRGTPVVIARLGSSNGTVIGYKEVDEFTVDLPGLHEAVIDSDKNIGATRLTIHPFIPNIRFEMNMFAHTATFGDGATTMSVETSGFDVQTGMPLFQQYYNPISNEIDGALTVTIQMPPEENKYCFRVSAYQPEAAVPATTARALVAARAQYTDEQEIEPATNVNGSACKAKMSKLVLCSGAPSKKLEIPTKTKSDGITHDLQIIYCFAAVFDVTNDTKYENGFDCKISDNSKMVHATETGSGIAAVQIRDYVFNDVLAVVHVTITADKDPVCVGKDVTFTAEVDFAGSNAVTVKWSNGGEPADGSGNTFTTKWTDSGTKTVTATISVEGFEDTCTVTKSVKVIDVKSLTVKDVAHPTNSATNAPDTELAICETINGNTEIEISASIAPDDDESKKCVLWRVDGAPAATTGNFGNGAATCVLAAGQRTFVVNAGCDSNKNGTLEDDEVVRKITVYVIKLSSMTVTEVDMPDNKATNPPDNELNVCGKEPAKSKIKIEAEFEPKNSATKKRVRWLVQGTGAAPASGDFSGADAPTSTLTPGDRLFVVKVWCDEDKSNTLSANEMPLEIKVYIPKVVIKKIDSRFAPSVEKLDIEYSIEPNGAKAKFAKLEVFKNGDEKNPIFIDKTITKTGLNIKYQWDGKKTDGTFVGPEDSPYTVKITLSDMEDFSKECSVDKKETKVEIHTIELNKTAAEKVIMNNPNEKVLVVATVKIKDKAGMGVVTEIEIRVDWKFADPNPANTPKADSYEYQRGRFLGKDANSLFWEAIAGVTTGSDDGYKKTAYANTSVAPGTRGESKINFLPSAVGGDDFMLTAFVKSKKDGSILATKDSGILTVWRRVKFDSLFEMDGITQISRLSVKANIQPFFDPAFVEYEAGATTPIPAAESVKYIGLWKKDGDHQESWATLQTKEPAEVPTADELKDYAGSDAIKQAKAKVAITAKAQKWVDRIDRARRQSWNAWLGNFPNNCIIGIQYFHPKYSPSAGEATTNEWPAGITVTTYGGNYPGKDPDGPWTGLGGDFGGLNMAGGRIALPKGNADATVTRSIAHEVGHATRANFERQVFGPKLDHSTAAGLMDISGTQAAFTARELNILRGIKQP